MDPRAPDMAVFSTDAVSPRERFAFWREAVCDVFVQLECERVGRDPFAGTITTRPFGAVQLSEVDARPQHVIRSRRQIARAREDDLLVSVQLDGHGTISQDGRTAALTLGDFCLYDSARPYTLHFDGAFRQLVLQFPRRRLAERLGRPEIFTGIRVARVEPVGALASQFLAALGRDNATIPAPVAEPGTIAGALGVATRSLHRLFEAEGTSFMRWVLEQRLAACARDLADPAHTGRSISDVALGHGFADLAHFSRAFRRRYGMAPRDFRAGAGSKA